MIAAGYTPAEELFLRRVPLPPNTPFSDGDRAQAHTTIACLRETAQRSASSTRFG